MRRTQLICAVVEHAKHAKKPTPSTQRGAHKATSLLHYKPFTVESKGGAIAEENVGMLLPVWGKLIAAVNPIEYMAVNELRGSADAAPCTLMRLSVAPSDVHLVKGFLLYKSSGISITESLTLFESCLGLSAHSLSSEANIPKKASGSFCVISTTAVTLKRLQEANQICLDYRRYALGNESIAEYKERVRLAERLQKASVKGGFLETQRVSTLSRVVMAQGRDERIVHAPKWGDEVRLRIHGVPLAMNTAGKTLAAVVKSRLMAGVVNYVDTQHCIGPGGLSKILWNIVASARASQGKTVQIGDLVLPGSGISQGTDQNTEVASVDASALVTVKQGEEHRYRYWDVVLPVTRFGAHGTVSEGLFAEGVGSVVAYTNIASKVLKQAGSLHVDSYRHVWTHPVHPNVQVSRDEAPPQDAHTQIFGSANLQKRQNKQSSKNPMKKGLTNVNIVMKVGKGVSIANMLRHVVEGVPLVL